MIETTTTAARALASKQVVKCHYCVSVVCTRIERNGYADYLRRLFGFYPWYCKTCGRRFFAWKRNYKLPGHVASRAARKSQAAALVFSILCLTNSGCVVTKPSVVTTPSVDTYENHREDAVSPKELRKFAEEGNVSAQYELGLLYKVGSGVPKSYGQAKRWFEEAAKQGHAEAQVNLGTLYLRGEGANYSSQMALFWFSRSAAQGNASACMNLGEMYAQPRGVPQDLIQAYMWFLLAGANGDESSATRRDGIGRKMAADQIAEAENRAQVWRQTGKSIAWK